MKAAPIGAAFFLQDIGKKQGEAAGFIFVFFSLFV